jgi:hypothetical protein
MIATSTILRLVIFLYSRIINLQIHNKQWCIYVKTAFTFFINALFFVTFAYGQPPLAEDIISKDLAITSSDQFVQKLTSLADQGAALLNQDITPENKTVANRVYTRLAILLEIYGKRYTANQQLRQRADEVLRDLSFKFALQSPLPRVVDITDVSVPPPAKAGNIESIFRFAQQDAGRPLTQTEAYLSRPSLQDMLKQMILEMLYQDTGQYNALISQAINQERIHRNQFVFYHGQANYFILAYDLIKEIVGRLEKKGVREAFDFLRVPGSQQFNKKLTEILQNGFKTDHISQIRNLLLPVNFSLFGNSARFAESTWAYFTRAVSVTPPGEIWKYLFDELGLNQKFIPELERLLTYLTAQEGNLLQIFIPKDKINDFVYLSKDYGKPLKSKSRYRVLTYPLKQIVYKDERGITHYYDPQTIDPVTYLSIYRRYPEAIDEDDMNLIQGRILLTNDFLLNPESAVKIYRYNTVPAEKMKIYKQKLSSLVDRMIMAQVSPEKLTAADQKLFEAIKDNDLALVQKALALGAHLDAKNRYSQTPLDSAKLRENQEIISFLDSYDPISTSKTIVI